MSLFRRPGESSSSSDDSSDGIDQTSASAEADLLSRIHTVDSTSSAHTGQQPTRQGQGPRPTVPRANTSTHVHSILLHSLLEEKAMTQAAEHLGKDKSDPEVQALAQQTYQDLARQISNPGDDYSSDDMRHHRAAAREGINRATRTHLTGLSGAAPLTAAPTSQALVTRDGTRVNNLESFLGLPSPIPLSLRGYPGLHTNRYEREYDEIEMVGKGGYGKVYKVKHRLDNAFYAVKRIVVSATRLQRIQDYGTQEMESLLEEVRSLAKFDHVNIVRYHNAWLEFTSGPLDAPLPSPMGALRVGRLLGDASGTSFTASDITNAHTRFGGLSVDLPYSTGDNIIFETSDTGPGAEPPGGEVDSASIKEGTSRRRSRRGSQATIATVSSTKSRLNTVEDVDEDDEEIETIPRTHDPVFEESESIMSSSDIPGHLVSTRPTGPVLTLNVQMSLYDSNLALFLTQDQDSPCHCFHAGISMELLKSIISGVEYLHERGVVHRDLKPANVFLSLSTSRAAPAGSVDLASCCSCSTRNSLHLTPRIGDFGLVAALSDGCLTAPAAARPVGTEFYRPPAGGKISEKLDVFALGVIAFEMVQRFGTRMERVEALTKLRRGEFPADFTDTIDANGDRVQDMISAMVNGNEDERCSCEDVRKLIERIVKD